MSLVQPYRARSTTEDYGSYLEIRIPSGGFGCATLFLGFWLMGWAFGECMVGGILLAKFAHIATPVSGFTNGGPKGGSPPYLFLITWFTMWTIGGSAALYTLLWQMAGREVIRIAGDSLTISRQVFGLGPVREYTLPEVKRLRTQPAPYSSCRQSSPGPWSGVLAFDYGARTMRFGSGIDEAEGQQIVEGIVAKFPMLNSS